MDDDDDEDNSKYDGEIIIGAPGPGEEGYEDEEVHEDNSWGATSKHITCSYDCTDPA
jgi:ribosome assembly protein SQT1